MCRYLRQKFCACGRRTGALCPPTLSAARGCYFCPERQKCNETLCVSYAKEICFANFFCARCKHLACQKRSSGRGKNQFFCFGYRKKFFIRKIFFTSKTRSVLRTPPPKNSLPTHQDGENFFHITRGSHTGCDSADCYDEKTFYKDVGVMYLFFGWCTVKIFCNSTALCRTRRLGAVQRTEV